MKQFPFGVLGLIVAALLFGGAASWLFEEEPIGVNFTVWVVAVLCVGAYVKRPATAAGYVPLAAALLFAVLFSWREGEPIKQFFVLTILVSCVLTAIGAHGRSLRVAYAHEYIVDAVQLGLSAFAVPLVMLRGLQQETTAIGRPRAAAALSTFWGVVIAIPALIVFGALFGEADPNFKKWFIDTLYIDFEWVGQHVILTLVFAAFAAIAWVLYLEGTPRTRTPREENPEPITWGSIEINVALGLISALFLCFVAIQLPHFFGGHEHVQTEANLTYAGYARQGFFELTTVAALSFALLIGSATLIQGATPKARVAYKMVSGVLIACVGVIIASALHRLSLYIDTYGVTSARLYAAWFIAWLAIAFAWLYITIFSDRFRTFAWGFLLSGYAAVFVLAVMNPDGLAVRLSDSSSVESPDIAQSTEDWDAWFLDIKSVDAIPALVDALPRLDDSDRNAVIESLNKEKPKLVERPYRNWTISLHNARAALAQMPAETSK
jgi:hypothetical protein